MKKFIFSLILLSLPMSLLANTQSSIKLQKYFQANCQHYSGTWQGFFTNPSDLFGNGGPWQISLSLVTNGNKIYGTFNEKNLPSYLKSALKGHLYANCDNGILKNIFVGETNQCGAVSQKGLLVAKNVLVLQTDYQNAMMDAPLVFFLKRSTEQNTVTFPKNPQWQWPSPKTCH